MDILLFLLMLAGSVCLFLAAISVGLTNRISIGWLGLFFWSLVVLIPMFPSL